MITSVKKTIKILLNKIKKGNNNIEVSYNCCPHCKNKLEGKESAIENGIQYICCSNCKYIAKLKNGRIIETPQNTMEIIKANELFIKADYNFSQYSLTKNGEKKSLLNLNKLKYENYNSDNKKEATNNVVYLDDYRN